MSDILTYELKIWRLPFREILSSSEFIVFLANGMCSRFSVLSAGGVRQFAKKTMEYGKNPVSDYRCSPQRR